jgi:DNA-binding CsgD family transcriptional regulator
MLIGRSNECRALDVLLDGARDGRSGALVLRGEPGVGKTALLGYAAERADGFRILRGTGVETEAELAFAALHQLVGRDLDRLDGLPEPQADALRAAFGLAPGHGSDPFLIAVGLLTVLADLAEETPTLCLVDDAQWLDEASASALLFVARRLEAERIAMLFAVREGEQRTFDAPGLPSLTVSGLDADAAAALLADRVGSALAPAVRDRLVEESAGNALALLDLPASLNDEQLAGREPLAEPLPMGAGLQLAYLSRVHRLPEETQSLLLFAAAEGSGELVTILRAAATAGLGTDALRPAEEEGLVAVVDGRLDFRHPLVRSAVYQGATFSERQTVHTAFAETLDRSNLDRRAWHRAATAAGVDDEIADELEAVADRASQRGGHAAAAAAFEKAAGLSPDDTNRTRRLLAAADAAWLAGRTDRARALVGDARRIAPAALSVEVTKLHGRIEVRSGVFEEACATLVDAATALAATQPEVAIDLLAEAEDATFFTGDLRAIVEIGLLAEDIDSRNPGGTDPFLISFLIGLGRGFGEGTGAGTRLLREALQIASTSSDPDTLLRAGRAAAFLGDDAVGGGILARAGRLARESGAVGALPRVLTSEAWAEFRTGRYSVGRMHAAEALRLARETGQEPGLALGMLALIAAAQGRDDECRSYASELSERAHERRASLFQSQADWAVGLLELGLGRFEDAARTLASVLPGKGTFAHPALARHVIPDYVEAAVRAGRRDGLDAVLAGYEHWARSANQPWTLGLLASCSALVAEDAAEDGLRAALELLPGSRRPFEFARTQLLLGELLRRNRKRREAREYLRAAIDTFEQLGAAPWEERARNELRASGETARKRDPSTLGELTPQELQIARLVGSGARNREVAAQLFLSPRTIDYHLRKVFMKLGISSRAELARLDVAAQEPALATV